MSEEAELKPCPFCGGSNMSVYPQTCRQQDDHTPSDRAFPMVRCMTCYCEVGGENFPTRFGDTSSAINAWNTRSDRIEELDAKLAKIEKTVSEKMFSVCNQYAANGDMKYSMAIHGMWLLVNEAFSEMKAKQ